MRESIASVTLIRVIPRPPRDVFEAWLDPGALARFMCPSEGMSVAQVEVAPQVGGAFLIVMRAGDRDLPHRGQYLAIERYERLVFSWHSAAAGPNSRVTLLFELTQGSQTKLTLEHTGLDESARERHDAGWSRILVELAGCGLTV